MTRSLHDQKADVVRNDTFEEGGRERSVKVDKLTSMEERHLVELAGKGDGSAFERIYRLHVGRTYALCLRMTGNETLAQELTQDCFVHVWNKLDKFGGKSSFGTWFHRLSVNVVLGHFRDRSRKRARIVAVDDVDTHRMAVSVEMPGKRMDLEAAISALPERARIVFILYEKEGYRHKEIGDMLDISPGTSKAHLHRARKFLRECLK